MAKYHPESPAILEAFAEGVNCAINVAVEQGKIPIEFQMLKFLPTPSWTSQSLLSRLPGWMLSKNASSELARAIAIRSMGQIKAEQVFPTEPHKNLTLPTGLDLDSLPPDALKISNGAGAGLRQLSPAPLKIAGPAGVAQVVPVSPGAASPQTVEAQLRDLSDVGTTSGLGSNSWVISGAKSATGKPNSGKRSASADGESSSAVLGSPGRSRVGCDRCHRARHAGCAIRS